MRDNFVWYEHLFLKYLFQFRKNLIFTKNWENQIQPKKLTGVLTFDFLILISNYQDLKMSILLMKTFFKVFQTWKSYSVTYVLLIKMPEIGLLSWYYWLKIKKLPNLAIIVFWSYEYSSKVLSYLLLLLLNYIITNSGLLIPLIWR